MPPTRTSRATRRCGEIHIPNDVSPPFHFSAVVPGIEVDKTRQPFRLSAAPAVKRPANLEDVAFWPVRHLAELVRTKQVTSVELTEMYLARLHRYNAQAEQRRHLPRRRRRGAGEAGRCRDRRRQIQGPAARHSLGRQGHHLGQGLQDHVGLAGLQGAGVDYDASVVEMLRDAGAVLIAKLDDRRAGGGRQLVRRADQEPVGSGRRDRAARRPARRPRRRRAASASRIGTETSGSILSPAARCGLAGLRPTFGRISRYGVMALSWTQDRLGPMCRYAEDCAIVMQAIAKPDGRDMSVSDMPFNWDAQLDVRKLRVGYHPGVVRRDHERRREAQRAGGARHAADARRDRRSCP